MNSNTRIIGTISAAPIFNHEKANEKFYLSEITTVRKSGFEDKINIIIPSRVMAISTDIVVGAVVEIVGAIRCRRYKDSNDVAHDFIYVLVESIEQTEYADNNEVNADCFICKEPVYRTTPQGREITDVCVAIDRNYGKSDYIHCIFWGRSAKYIANVCKVGDRLNVAGRLQSREYTKFVNDIETTRVVYEISVNAFNLDNEGE